MLPRMGKKGQFWLQAQGLCYEGAGSRLRAVPQQGTRCPREPPTCPGSPSPGFCRTLICAQGLAGLRRRLCSSGGCLPGGCLRASTELPARASPALAALPRQTQMGADSPARAVKIKPREPRAAVSAGRALGAPPGAAAPVLPCQGAASPLCPRCVPAWLQRGGAAGGCPRCCDHCRGSGRGAGALPALGFQSGRCTRRCQHSGPAPLAGLSRQGCSCAQHLPRDCTPAAPWAQGRGGGGPGARHCRKLLWKGPSAVPASPASGNLNLGPPAPGSGGAGGCGSGGWCRRGGAGVVACRKQSGRCPCPGGTRCGWGRAGSTHLGHAKEQRHLMPAAPRELRARHGSLTLL